MKGFAKSLPDIACPYWRCVLYRQLNKPLACNPRSEEHTSELQSRSDLVCRLLLEKKNNRPPGSAWSLPYRMRIISPPTAFTETHEADPKIVSTQLHHSWLAANDMILSEIRLASIVQHRN